MTAESTDPRRARSVMRALTIVALIALIASIVLALATESTTLKAIALMLGGCACILGVCLAFYAVGRSEDEQRAREQGPV
jgi:F0F1-type ATP synthase assembly protein I